MAESIEFEIKIKSDDAKVLKNIKIEASKSSLQRLAIWITG